MAKCCRRKRKMCKTRCRSRHGRFKRCRSGDRRYRVGNRCRSRSNTPCRRRKRRCGKKPRYTLRCRSRRGSFKRCNRCDRRYRVRRRRDSSGGSYMSE